jgi:hypothetical protein
MNSLSYGSDSDSGFGFEALVDQRDLPPPNPYRYERDPAHTVATMAGHLQEALHSGDMDHTRWLPGRLVAAALADKIARPEAEGHLSRVRTLTDMALKFYEGTLTAEECEGVVDSFAGDAAFMQTAVRCVTDTATEAGTIPRNCRAAANVIAGLHPDSDVLLIPLATGGVVAGMQTHLYHRRLTGSQDSALYPVRFSKHKAGDEEPQLTNEERELLLSSAEDGLRPVVLDEDVGSGQTLRAATEYFRKAFGTRVDAVFCYDVTRLDKYERPTAGTLVSRAPLYPSSSYHGAYVDGELSWASPGFNKEIEYPETIW